MLDLPGKLFDGCLLGAGEELNSPEAQIGVLLPALDQGEDLLLVDAKLAVVGEPQKNGKLFAVFLRQSVQRGKLGQGFHGIGPAIGDRNQRLQKGGGLVQPGDHRGFRRNTQRITDAALPRGADLQFFRRPQGEACEEGICLDGIGQGHVRPQKLPHMADALPENPGIENVIGSILQIGIFRHISALLSFPKGPFGRFFRSCSGAWLPPAAKSPEP